MIYFKDVNDGFYSLLTDTHISTLPHGSVEITEAEFLSLNPPSAEVIAANAKAAKDAEDAEAAKSYAKLTALKGMTPAEIQVWVAANVTTLAQAQDAITTLAIGVGLLARRL